MQFSMGLGIAIALVCAPLFVGFDCGGAGADGGGGPSDTAAAGDVTWTSADAKATVAITRAPFALRIADLAGNVLLESSSTDALDALDAADPQRAYAPLAITHDEDTSVKPLMFGWSYYRGHDDPWKRATTVTSIDRTDARLDVHVATSDGAHPSMTISFDAKDGGLHVVARPDANADGALNRVSLGFRLHDDDHFMGFGERFVRADHRGQMLYTWVEDGGFGHGEETPPGPHNPSPNGEGQTNMPLPWFMSPRGFGFLLNGTFRGNFHLGEERADAWRVEATTGALDATIFVDPDPMNLVADLTAVTGRPPEIADWVLAPRRRADLGSDEAAKLRAAHVPTSVIDTAVHYFPNGGGEDHAAMKAATADLHARGFKAIAYFCPFVASEWHPVFDDLAAKGWLVKRPDGTPYVVLDPPYTAAMIDFTNPDAVAWYQSKMREAVDDGWDGWMYDFGEYVPQDGVFANGKSGMEMHNAYPVLYQQAAFDLMQQLRPKDYLFFVRSGFLGTSGRVPMVWAGDQSTDFDLADGLPAALTGALNAGMSGIPLWGSDISGYHFLYNPPPDEEVYLRWTELGAFSADMHDENDGAGNGSSSDRWQIWKSQRSIDVYRTYAALKTRMLPYVKTAVREARERGTPVMRHPYLTSPRDPRVYAMTDEYFYGDALLVAPVVARGARSRSVYLPSLPGGATYFDYWTGARVPGGGDVTAAAPLETVPVYARAGAIVPLLAPDVETLVPSSDGSVVSAADREGTFEVQVFASGDGSITLDDGTVLSASAPPGPFSLDAPTHAAGPIAAAATDADLWTCDACARAEGDHLYAIAVRAASDEVHAGALTLRVDRSPSVKRFVFTVRY